MTLSVGLAGCSFLGSSSDRANATYEPTVGDQLAVAVGNLNTVALAIRAVQQQGPTEEATFDEEQPREQLAEARRALERASDSATNSDQQANIEAVDAFAETMANTLDTVSNLLVASTGLADARAVLEDDETDVQSAREYLESASDASTTAVQAHEAARTTLTEADGDRLQRLDAEYQAMVDGLDALAGFVIGVDGLTGGYATQVSGIERLQTAQEQIDDEEFDAVDDTFTAARDSFERSAEQFRTAIDAAASTLVSELETGDEESRSLKRLTDGYLSILTGRERVLAAEEPIENDRYEPARTALTEGRDEATTAMEQFDTGDEILDDRFEREFEAGRARATALDTLVDGYLTLVDAREQADTGDKRFQDDAENARSAFTAAAELSQTASETFQSRGNDEATSMFDQPFEQAQRRATALETLSTGHVTLLDAREDIRAGRDALDGQNFEAAETHFESAGERISTAETTFVDGRDESGDEAAEEFDRALCRTTHLNGAVDHFITAAQAGQNRDLTAVQEAIADGEAELDHVDEC